MSDLDKAKDELHGKNLTLVIVKDGLVLFETSSHRVSGFLDAIEVLGHEVEGAFVADRVVGKAVAMLCVYIKAKGVYAVVMSRQASEVLIKHQILYESDQIVDSILDLNKLKICHFEKRVETVSEPEEAYVVLKNMREKMKSDM
jgi:hypothetical protein